MDPIPESSGSRARRRWAWWAPYAAAAWSVGYAALALSWWADGRGFPFGPEADPSASITILPTARAEDTAPVIALLGLVGTVVAIVMARGWGRGALRAVILGFGVAAAVTLALVIPDYRVLVITAYGPIVLLGAPFGWPPETDILAVVTWPVINQVVCIGGGLLWATAAVAYWRAGNAARPTGAGPDDAARWTSPGRAARWGRWATYVAFAIPLVYALTRWVWALGIPLGISDELLRAGEAIGLWFFGAALATLAVVGAILTLGLTQRWGEVFPRWLPLLAGRQVPVPLVVVPAGLVAVLVTSAGLMFWRLTLAGGFRLGGFGTITVEESWAALLPELIWPAWGVALGAATFAYHLRRAGSDSRQAERETSTG